MLLGGCVAGHYRGRCLWRREQAEIVGKGVCVRIGVVGLMWRWTKTAKSGLRRWEMGFRGDCRDFVLLSWQRQTRTSKN